MKVLPFIKMHGIGNDYVYIDCFQKSTADLLAQSKFADLARSVSDRHFGVGSDGMVLIMPSEEADAEMRIFNADGSEAEMCGNAIRCVGKYLYENGIRPHLRLHIMTKAGVRELSLHVKNNIVEQVTVNMGEAKISPDSLSLNERDILGFSSVNIGNPHAVFFREIAYHEVQKIVPRNVHPDLIHFSVEHLFQIFLEIAHEHLPALAGKDPLNISAAVLQVIKDMGDLTPDVLLSRREIVRSLFGQVPGENVVKDLRAQRSQKLVLGLKV